MNVSYRQIGSASNQKESKLFVEAYLRLFNDPKNLPFLSATGIPFKTGKLWKHGCRRRTLPALNTM